MLSYEQIKELIKEVDSSTLRVFQLECSDIKLKLSKNEESVKEESNTPVNIPVGNKNNVEISNSTVVAANEINEVNIEEASKDENYNVVKSPLVGTYYSAAAPGGEPYVKVGSRVKKGDVLCIIEAMKIMNEITSEFDGEVVEVLRNDEEIVEFGMELFRIK